MRRLLAAAIAAIISVAALSCRDPTEITVTITTDAACSDLQGVSIAIGTLGDALESKPVSAQSFRCDASGRVGTLVVVPSGAKNDELAFRVTAGYRKKVDECAPPFGPGCIVARRALRYIPHTPLFVPVKLSVLCDGIACDATSTCEEGRCVDARVADPTQCESPDGCSLLDGGAPPDTGTPDGAPPPHDAGPPTARAIASVGSFTAETGTAQQHHVLYAAHSARFWFFFIDAASPSTLKTSWSSDFATWTPGATFSLAASTSNDGRNFSVAYADLGGKDVVHIAFSHASAQSVAADHVRATIDGATIAFGAETTTVSAMVSNAAGYPDGPVAAVSSDGHVLVGTGWANEKQFRGFDTIGNMDVYASAKPDDGANVGPIDQYLVHSFVQDFVRDRALVPMGGGRMLAVWTMADVAPDSSGLSWADSAMGWTTSATLFGIARPTAPNDWSVCGVSATSAHVVRRLVNGGANDTYEHSRFDTTSGSWTAGGAIPTESGAYDTGIVLLTNGVTMLLFSVAADAANSVRYTKWDGAAWSAWSTLFGATASRAFLGGSGCGTKNAAAIVWTEGVGGPYGVAGAEVTALF